MRLTSKPASFNADSHAGSKLVGEFIILKLSLRS
jgi:hypothetical protein